jgi:hypothetical protein
MVVVDKLSNSAHFIPVKSTCRAIDITQIFIKRDILTAQYAERDNF